MNSISPQEFRQALSHYPTGVSVITALPADGQPAGMVVGTFTSVSLEPPLVAFLPATSSTTWPKIESCGKFAVNILAHSQLDICQKFATPGGNKFEGVDYDISTYGLPVIRGCVAVIECDIENVVPAGDHVFVLGRVLSADYADTQNPLLFLRRSYGQFQAN